jgi:tripartite-type tricarboxylate transporter receptor subunit TctC
LKEGKIDVEVVGWNALVAPAGTPNEVIAFLNGHVRAVVESEDFKKRMLELGGAAQASSPEELDTRLNADIAMWAAVVKKAGLEPH